MSSYSYKLEVAEGQPNRLAAGWLFVALGSLIFGGGVPVAMIVLSRMPFVSELVPWGNEIFKTAITVHVDLTVLIWFLACAGILWSINSTARNIALGWAGIWLTVIGSLIFTFAPFFGSENPLLNNYIPVLDDTTYLVGLIIVGIGFTLFMFRSLIDSCPMGDLNSGGGVLRFGLHTGLVASVLSVAGLIATYVLMSEEYNSHDYYELLFWGGGHILQFTHTQLMCVAWLWLATVVGLSIKASPRIILVILVLGFLPVLYGVLIYFMYDVDSSEHIVAFTDQMIWGSGIAALPIGLMLFFAFFSNRKEQQYGPEWMSLLFSIILFGAGGLIGYLISGIDVTIPAHYHGSIVSVTLAFMGVIYYLLPKLGFAAASSKWAFWQPALYGFGQLMHVIGLAWSGSHGVQRKTAGAEQGLETLSEQAAMIVMGIGGGISVIGGLVFLVVVIISIKKGRAQAVA